MPKAVRIRTKLTRLARELETPYSSVGTKISSLSAIDEDALSGRGDVADQTQNRRKNVARESSSKANCLEARLQQLISDKEDVGNIHSERMLSRGQRKRKTKKEKLQRKFDFVKYREQVIKEERDRKEYGNALVDFSSITQALQDTQENNKSPPTPNPLKPKSRKAKSKQMQQELETFQRILQFPPYQQDPIGSIQKHLENSMKLQEQRKQFQKGLKN